MSENIEAGWTSKRCSSSRPWRKEGESPSVMCLKLKRPVTAIHA